MSSSKILQCSSRTDDTSSLLVVDQPNQPLNFKFPQREFGCKTKVKRSFQATWFKRWRWLHYDESNDLAFCYLCTKAYKEKKLTVGNVDKAFILNGFFNWKDACVKLAIHEQSHCHKESVEKIVTLPSTVKDVGEMLSSEHKQEKMQRQQMLLKIISNVRFLARQALPLRGDGNEVDSNFMQLLLLSSNDNKQIKEWVQKKTDKYTSPVIQNEIIKIMSLKVAETISGNLQATPFYSIMADETTDCSNKEQFVVCFRWVDSDFEVHEEFVGLRDVKRIDAETLSAELKDVLVRLNLSPHKMRGQCYDGASCMAGMKSGVATRLSRDEPRAVYTHCYGHALSLACSDAIKQCKVMKESLETTHEITKLIKLSPRRDALFDGFKEELAPDSAGVRALCPHRWTVRAQSLKSILDNYEALCATWEEAVDIAKDTETKSRILGVSTQMEKFDYFFGLMLRELILSHTDNLSCTLQKTTISAAQGQSVAKLTVTTLRKIRNDNSFELFWQKVVNRANSLSVADPQLPRKRKAPRRFEHGSAAPEFPSNPFEHYKIIYFEALDLITSCIDSRFEQPGYKVYSQLEELLIKSAKGYEYQSEYEFITGFYGSDFSSTLKVQLLTYTTLFSNLTQQEKSKLTFTDLLNRAKAFSPAEKELLSEICKLIHLILVMPATNAVSERSFSSLRRLKTYLRSTMHQNRLNH